MRDQYVHQRSMHRHRYSKFRRRFAILVITILAIVGLAILIFLETRGVNTKSIATSKAEESTIADQLHTFTSPYFEFRDTGKWVLDEKNSTPSKFTYTKFHGQEVRGQLSVYVNETPIALFLASSRALPVRVVNYNSFDVTSVSSQCSQQYQPGELHKVKVVNINGAAMLCDPDTSAYSVELAQITGDYRLNLRKANGSPIQIIIIYKSLETTPKPDSILQIAKSFRTL